MSSFFNGLKTYEKKTHLKNKKSNLFFNQNLDSELARFRLEG